MRKKRKLVAAALFLAAGLAVIPFVTFFGARSVLADQQLIVDDQDLLSEEEETELQAECEEFYDKNGTRIFIMTAGSNQIGSSTEEGTIQYIEKYGWENMGDDYVGLIVNMDIRYYYIDVYGSTPIRNFTDNEQSKTGDAVASALGDGDYYKAFERFISYADSALNSGEYDASKPVEKNIPFRILIAALAAAGVSGIATLVMAAKHHPRKMARSAEAYEVPGSMNLNVRSDRFVREYVTRVAKQQNNSSGGGGHTSTHSSSGGSHSGHGGHF